MHCWTWQHQQTGWQSGQLRWPSRGWCNAAPPALLPSRASCLMRTAVFGLYSAARSLHGAQHTSLIDQWHSMLT